MTDNLEIDDSLTVEESMKLYESKWWVDKTHDEITRKQLFTSRLIMPWDKFHEAVVTSLGRNVYSHEFAKPENLQREFLGLTKSPSLD